MARFYEKTTRAFVAFLVCIVCLFSFSFAAPSPTREFFVNDFANVLNSQTRTHIINYSADLERQTGAQVVVVTVASLEGKNIEIFANEIFNSFGIGQANKNNGILILLAPGEREVRIEVGYGLEGAINDAKSGRIIDSAMSSLKSSNWNNAITTIYNGVLAEVYHEYGLEMPVGVERIVGDNSSSGISDLMAGILIVIVLLLLTFGGRGGRGLFWWMFFSPSARRNRRYNTRGGYSGGFGGGGSSRGAGGSFRGGGGRSGGGGASRRF